MQETRGEQNGEQTFGEQKKPGIQRFRAPDNQNVAGVIYLFLSKTSDSIFYYPSRIISYASFLILAIKTAFQHQLELHFIYIY